MILFTDLDETLLNQDSKISEYTKGVLKKWTDEGHRLVLSSGRPLDSILEVKRDAGLDFPGMFIVGYNGCLVYDCDQEKPIRELTVPFEYIPFLQQKAQEMGLHIQTYTEHEIVSRYEDEEVTFYRKKIHLPLILSDELCKPLRREPFKMLAISLDDRPKMDHFVEDLRQWSGGKVQMIFSTPKFLEIFSYLGGKGDAVTWLCDYLDIPISKSYAAGDQANDISMLQAAGCGIAMCNGTEEIRAVADRITEYDNRNDGLARLLEEYL